MKKITDMVLYKIHIRKKIMQKIDTVLSENETLMSEGNINQYQNNCNFIAGLSFALGRLQ